VLIDTLEWSLRSSNGKTPESEDSGVWYSLEFVRNTEISAWSGDSKSEKRFRP
jgi:hypothetical protein